MFPLYLGGLVCILIWCECLIFEKVSLHFHRVSLSNTEPTLQGFRGLKQHGDFRSFVLQFQVVRSEGHFRKRKIDSNLFFHRFHFFLSRKSSFVWCDCPSRNLYSVGEDLVLCRRCFLCEHFHSIQHAGWCCAWVSWDYITKVFVQYLLWLLFEILCLQWLRTRYNVRVCEEKNLSSWEPMRLTRSMRRTMSQEWALRTKNAVQRDTFPGLHQQTFEVIVRTVLSIRSVLDSVRIYECWCLSWVCVRECSLDVLENVSKEFYFEHGTQRTTSDTSPWTEHPSWNVSRAKQRWRILKCHDNNPSRPRNGSISNVYHPCFRPTELHQTETGVGDSHPKTTHRVNPRVPSCICWFYMFLFLNCIYGVASLGRRLYLWLAYERGILSQCFPFGMDFLGCLGCARASDLESGSTNNNEWGTHVFWRRFDSFM